MTDDMTASGIALHRSAKVAVIGAGTMGAGIAQVAVLGGHDVLLYDTREGAARAGCQKIEANLRALAANGRYSPEQIQAAGTMLPVDSLAELNEASLVIEAIIEDLKVKQDLFRQLEQIVATDAILVTNTSSLSITAVAAELLRPQRIAGFHFFNPAPLMRLVEVVSGLATSRETLNTLSATAAAWGKKPVFAKSTPGFIVNRVARPFYGEALRLLEEQTADTATIDAIVREAGGFRMGPFELMDMIGQDVNFAVTNSMFAAFSYDRRYLPSLIQKELVEAGWLGRKSGRGFYDYASEVPRPAPSTHPIGTYAGTVRIEGTLGVAECLVEAIRKAGFIVSRTAGEGFIRLEGASLALTDGRTAAARVAEGAPRDLVLFDLALDFESTSRIALARAAQAAPEALDRAAGLFQALNKAVSVIADAPGMVVMRTFAMLANEAADVVARGVASAEAVNLAMKFGVNYPVGPLDWAQRLGAPMVLTVLQNLQRSYGDDRYRPALSWRQEVASQTLPAHCRRPLIGVAP